MIEGQFQPPSLIPRFYLPPLETPLYWGDEQSGVLPAAVRAFMNECLGEGHVHPLQINLLAQSCDYFINAPCWENNLKDCEEMLADLVELRERAKTLASIEGIRRWYEECVELGIDPF